MLKEESDLLNKNQELTKKLNKNRKIINDMEQYIDKQQKIEL